MFDKCGAFVIVSSFLCSSLLTGCGGGGPTVPSGASPTSCTYGTCPSTSNTTGVNVVTSSPAAYTYTLAGLMTSASGSNITDFVNLAAGDYQVTGQYGPTPQISSDPGIYFDFYRSNSVDRATGGFQYNSIINLAACADRELQSDPIPNIPELFSELHIQIHNRVTSTPRAAGVRTRQLAREELNRRGLLARGFRNETASLAARGESPVSGPEPRDRRPSPAGDYLLIR